MHRLFGFLGLCIVLFSPLPSPAWGAEPQHEDWHELDEFETSLAQEVQESDEAEAEDGLGVDPPDSAADWDPQRSDDLFDKGDDLSVGEEWGEHESLDQIEFDPQIEPIHSEEAVLGDEPVCEDALGLWNDSDDSAPSSRQGVLSWEPTPRRRSRQQEQGLGQTGN